MRIDLGVHIVAGSVALIAGFTALAVSKGGPIHRRVGMAFVWSMVTMALMGAFIAAARDVAAAGNVPIGLFTTYLVLTSLATVRPESPLATARVTNALLAVVATITAALFTFGFVASSTPKGVLHGLPTPVFFVFGTLALIAVLGDIQLIRTGGVAAIRGAPRLARHLWRMNLALLIAAFSFFLGQARVIPKPIRIYPLLMLPPLIVLVALFYWLWKVRFRRSLRGLVLTRPSEAVL
jgi:uncharacterized membrane protein